MKKSATLLAYATVICGFLLTSCFSGKLVTTARIQATADQVWTYSMTHPDGFTLDLRTMTEPTEGIAVSYSATQGCHSREALDYVVTSCGGRIRYQTPAVEISFEGKQWAVHTKDEVLTADVVIVSADARSAIDTLFKEPLQDGWAKKMQSGLRTTQCMFLGVGVKADLSSWPRSMRE